VQRLPLRLRDQLPLTTTVGYGPRFLHFTGHLHKSDANNNVLFTRFTVDLLRDLRIPEEAGSPKSIITFGVLKKAQALDDR
jgi:transaldolase / glucose-6-phosphate isomerase